MSYDAADNSAKCYSLAVHELRLQGLRDGKFKPLDIAEELIASGKAKDYRRIGPHVLYNGDCAGILPLLGKVDAVITDPPYGIGIAANPVRQKHAKSGWDDATPDDGLFEQMMACSKYQIIWGGNYFGLPASQGFLVWDKVQPQDFSLAMCEQAWTNVQSPAKLFRRHVVSFSKEHPTQKPLELMQWCVERLPDDVATIFDPFMGSGTTIVAAQKLGKIGIGIEREPKYFDIACRRLEQAMQQQDLFVKTPEPKPVQEALPL